MAKRRPLAERFWEKVEKSDGCWLWRGALDGSGYGLILVERRPRKASRVAYQLAVGAIPPGFNVLHSCDTPACVRPDHLSVGTQRDNMQDCARKGRLVTHFKKKAECSRGHPFDAINTRLDRVGHQHCRICDRDRDAERTARRRARRAYEVRPPTEKVCPICGATFARNNKQRAVWLRQRTCSNTCGQRSWRRALRQESAA